MIRRLEWLLLRAVFWVFLITEDKSKPAVPRCPTCGQEMIP